MKAALAPFVAVALIPAMTGSLVAASPQAIMVALCGGGTMAVPSGAPQLPGSANTPCCAKGCHGSSERRRLDRTQ